MSNWYYPVAGTVLPGDRVLIGKKMNKQWVPGNQYVGMNIGENRARKPGTVRRMKGTTRIRTSSARSRR